MYAVENLLEENSPFTPKLDATHWTHSHQKSAKSTNNFWAGKNKWFAK